MGMAAEKAQPAAAECAAIPHFQAGGRLDARPSVLNRDTDVMLQGTQATSSQPGSSLPAAPADGRTPRPRDPRPAGWVPPSPQVRRPQPARRSGRTGPLGNRSHASRNNHPDPMRQPPFTRPHETHPAFRYLMQLAAVTPTPCNYSS
jgi:hypothetical protein